MSHVFEPMDRPVLAVAGSDDTIPVRRIFCAGLNYAAHARELGLPDEGPPIFFFKPADTLVPDGATIPYPRATKDLQHEAELVAVIGKGGLDIPAADALSHVWGYAAGNDLTLRDVQVVAREEAMPWDMSKGFDRSAVIGPAIPAAEFGDPGRGRIQALVNGEVRQDSDLSDMITPLEEIIAALSAVIELKPGDLIFTGTPENIGPLAPGDTCEVRIDRLPPARVTIAAGR